MNSEQETTIGIWRRSRWTWGFWWRTITTLTLYVWLLPLVAGVLLIGGVLLLETRRAWVEKHLATWGHLLRQWQ